ncbi:MAG: epimerase [Chloroflexi bacterium RBG_13_60_9]|nr:MAG: epimerase [Chloroflexi bacterium RBG_13_60_9]
MVVVTGSFGYIGRHITRRLLDLGQSVRTVTTHVDKPNPFGPAVAAFPYGFDQPDRLTTALRGADILYNTYWIRFEYGGLTFEKAVGNTRILFDCARQAGVRKIVHVSVTGNAQDSPLPYYRGKAAQERLLRESGLSWAIVRPTLVYGGEDILVNNIAWLMRKFPVFPIFGDGRYAVQPVHVEDVAEIAVRAADSADEWIVDAAGPERFAFRDFVRRIAAAVHPGIPLWRMPPVLGIASGRVIGWAIGDVLLTANELRGLMDNLLVSDQAPGGKIKFSEWLQTNRDRVGRSYASEIKRHYQWKKIG